MIFTDGRRIILSGDQSGLLRDLNGLRATSGIELVEEPARVGLHGVLADEELFGDLAVAEPRGDESEDLMLARGDAQLFESGLVDDEGPGLANDDHFPGSRHLEPKPDAERSEDQCHQSAVDLPRVLDDDKAVLGELEEYDENAAEKAIDEYGATH